MSRFSECLAFVLAQEGGYSNHPADHGGETNFGVTSAVYDDHRAKRGVPLQSVKLIDPEEVEEIYRAGYWRPCAGDLLPAPLDLIAFDAAVNSGVGQGVKFIQRALSVTDDGKVGPKTIEAALVAEKSGAICAICGAAIRQRSFFYQHLVEKDPTQKAFLRGWAARIESLKGAVARYFSEVVK